MVSSSKEVWKPISCCPRYRVSSLGRIQGVKVAIMKPWAMSGGHLFIRLRNKNGYVGSSVHRLVAETFIPNPHNKPEVNHKDCNPQNNKVENLEWVTHKENAIHSYNVSGRKGVGPIGQTGARSKCSIPVLQMTMNGKVICEFAGISEAERITGIANSNICNVCKGKKDNAGGFRWKYKYRR